MELVKCEKCGENISETMGFCPACGEVVVNNKSAGDVSNHELKKTNVEFAYTEKIKGWILAAFCFFLMSIIMIGMGIYKYVAYSNPEYGETTNAYVGGDAYNYIINANYTTGFYVLATMFALIGIGCIIIYYLAKIDRKTKGERQGFYYFPECGEKVSKEANE